MKALGQKTALDYLGYYEAALGVCIASKDRKFFERRKYGSSEEVETAVRGYGIFMLHKVHLAGVQIKHGRKRPRLPYSVAPWRFEIFRMLTKLAWRLGRS